MKKYHHNPTFGVRSGRRRLALDVEWKSEYMTPYVEVRNSHDPTKAQLNNSKTANAVIKMVVNLKIEAAYTKFKYQLKYLRSSGDLSKAILMEEVTAQDISSDNLPWPIPPSQLLQILHLL